MWISIERIYLFFNMRIFSFLKEIGFPGAIDFALMNILLYSLLVWFKQQKAVAVLRGILICAIIYLFSIQFNLLLTSYVLRAFFAVILIAMIVIFQEELRYFFEKVALWNFRKKKHVYIEASEREKNIEVLVRTLFDLARQKIGALVVLQGKDSVSRHLQGGIRLQGEISEAILKSIFDPNSIGHDGAVLLVNQQIVEFGSYLPLSTRFIKTEGRGTRHAAAMGVAERSDALCLVVSEERGSISIISGGEIKEIKDPVFLAAILRKFYDAIYPETPTRSWRYFIKKNYREKVGAFILTLALWYVLVYESELVYKTYNIPVEYSQLSDTMYVSEVNPNDVEVTFSGPRSAFHFLNEKNIHVNLKLFNASPGEKQLLISESNFTFPKEIYLENISTKRIKVKIEKK